VVKIGNQVWMAENLNYNASGSKCYDNKPANCDKYGRLYDWNTAMRVCPSGWHLPSEQEWEKLTAAVGGEESKNLKAKSGWINNGNGLDTYGFSALPGGYGNSDGSFSHVGYYGYWWSASEINSNDAYSQSMSYSEGVYFYFNDKDFLRSVRCLQN